MGHVSGRVTRMVLEALEARGIDPSEVVEGVPHTLDVLRDVRARIPWNDFAALFSNIERAVGGPAEIERLGASVVRMPSYGIIGTAASFIVSPRHLHELGARYFAPAFFPGLPVELVVAGEHTIVVRCSLPPTWRSCEAHAHYTKGAFSAISTLLGLPPSVVEGPIGPRGFTFTITLPREQRGPRVWLRRLRARVAGVSVEALLEQQDAVNESYQALLRRQDEFRDLLERAPIGAMIHADGRCLWANAAAAEMFGWDHPHDLVGRAVLDFVHPDDRARVIERLQKPASASMPAEYRALRRDGSSAMWEFAAAHDVVFQGTRARLILGTDITERARVREQLALNDRMTSLGIVAAGVAHEINNPLTYVQLNVQQIARELHRFDVPASLRAAADTAVDGLERVVTIVGDLRTFSRANDDTRGPVDLNDVVSTTLRLGGKSLSESAKIELSLGDIPPVVGNRGQLGQVVLNLLINAHEAIKERGTAGVIRVQSVLAESGDVVLEIADNGAGIPDEALARVFEPFFTTKPVGRGTGLGLAICHRIVTGYGGDITIESTRATDGSPKLRTFARIRLRVAQAEHAPPSAPARSATERRRRILVIDDEPAVGSAIRAILGDANEVTVVHGGREALRLLDETTIFDAVLCDVMMPEVDGIALFEELSRSHPELARRTVFMSGGAFTARARTFLSSCPNPRIEKPFSLDQLSAALERAALS